MASPKWKIKGVTGKLSFNKAAVIILNKKIDNLNKQIKRFLKSNTAEDLHNVRISLRRLRYNMELFYALFERKKFLKFYSLIENLQDQTGNVRDIYILKQNILIYEKEYNIKIPNEFNLKLEERDEILKDNLTLELSSFIHSVELKNFMKSIKL
jgi:CHAD domain-containing protein